jgi:hypothetical protein
MKTLNLDGLHVRDVRELSPCELEGRCTIAGVEHVVRLVRLRWYWTEDRVMERRDPNYLRLPYQTPYCDNPDGVAMDILRSEQDSTPCNRRGDFKTIRLPGRLGRWALAVVPTQDHETHYEDREGMRQVARELGYEIPEDLRELEDAHGRA